MDLVHSISQRITSFSRVKPFLFKAKTGVISFTFDDFPINALAVGGRILEEHGRRGTFYVVGGLTNTQQNNLPMHAPDDILAALQRGHEIGSQGFQHIDYSRLKTKEIDFDIDQNQRFVRNLIGHEPTSFSYPFGSRRVTTKRQVAKRFVTARGIERGINFSPCDLSDLRANAIYLDGITRQQIRHLIEETAENAGWLIFYTHDVSDTPTKWGTTPKLLEYAVQEAVMSGCHILPIDRAVKTLSSERLDNEPFADDPQKSKADHDTMTVIAIVGYRNPDDVSKCLDALSLSTEKRFVVSICENGGFDAYERLIENLKDVVAFDGTLMKLGRRISGACWGHLRMSGQIVRIYCAEQNLGYAGAINLMIEQVGDNGWCSLWILNPDTEPHPDALKALTERVRRDHYDLVSSRLVYKPTGRVQSYGGRWRSLQASGFNIGQNSLENAVADIDYIQRTMNYVSGASLFVTRKYIDDVGLLDERYFLYCEEVDWCLRRQAHHRIGYAHQSIVYHSYGTTIGSNTNPKNRSRLSVYLDQRNGLLLTRRFYPTLYPVVIGVSVLQAVRMYLRKGAVSNFFIAMRGWFAGLRGEEGPPKQYLPSE